MPRKPRRTDIASARQSQRRNPPIRFVRDWDHVTIARTIAFKAGTVIEPESAVRVAALTAKAAVIHRA